MLRNDADVPAEVLAAARETASAAYAAAGVEIAWTARPPMATVALLPREKARQIRHRPEVIGFATGNRARGAKMAYVFVHRVEELAARYRLPASAILGAAIAHELGHLMLPHDAHTDIGLMRPILDHADFRKANRGELLFSRNQAVQIREAIEPRASFRR